MKFLALARFTLDSRKLVSLRSTKRRASAIALTPCHSSGGSMSEHKRQVRTESTADQKATKRDESNLAATGRDAELELSAEELEERIAPMKSW